MKPRDAERSKNFFALGLISWMYTRPVDPTLDWIQREVRVAPDRRRRQRRRVQGRAALRRDGRAVRSRVPGAARRAPAGALPQHQREPRPRVRAHRGGAARQPSDPLRVVPDHAGVRHPPRAVEPQELRRAHAAGRRRDRRDRRRHRCGVRRPARRHRHERSGRRPQERRPRPRDEPRAPAVAHRRAARRSVDRAAHQDRAVRPPARDVRPPRRGAGADHRGALAEPLLRGRVRGGAHRARSTARR